MKFFQIAAIVFSLSGVAIIGGICLPHNAMSQEKKQQQPTVKKKEPEQVEFMRKKLEASNQILEGLVTEDSDLVVKGANTLIEMSSAEKWQVQHDVMYKQSSAEFQQSAKKLVEAAKKENFDAVALKWIDTTMKCIECHNFVRGMRVAK